MAIWVSRVLLVAAALILAIGGILHGAAYFSRAVGAIASSNLTPVIGNQFKVLWLADSTTLLSMAAILAVIVARLPAIPAAVVMSLALVPAATAGLIYAFLGPFYAGHMLLGAAAMVLVAGMLSRPRHPRGATAASAA